MAEDNRDWGYRGIQGALSNLGHAIARSTIAAILQRHGLEPAPERGRKTTWKQFVSQHWELIIASPWKSGAALANDPKADGFVLARLRQDQIPTSSTDVKDYLRAKLPAEFYAAFVPIGSGTVYFIWVREDSDWRISHASLVCM